MHFTGTKCSLQILLLMKHKNVKLAWRAQAAKTIETSHKVRKGGQDQESIQSSATPDPGYEWESDKNTIKQWVAHRGQYMYPHTKFEILCPII